MQCTPRLTTFGSIEWCKGVLAAMQACSLLCTWHPWLPHSCKAYWTTSCQVSVNALSNNFAPTAVSWLPALPVEFSNNSLIWLLSRKRDLRPCGHVLCCMLAIYSSLCFERLTRHLHDRSVLCYPLQEICSELAAGSAFLEFQHWLDLAAVNAANVFLRSCRHVLCWPFGVCGGLYSRGL